MIVVLYGVFQFHDVIPGVKYIPLRTPGGELISESGLFLRIKMEAEEGGPQQRRKTLHHQTGVVGENNTSLYNHSM